MELQTTSSQPDWTSFFFGIPKHRDTGYAKSKSLSAQHYLVFRKSCGAWFSMLKDSIHLRCPLSWRGRVRSRQVRKWFKKLEEGQGRLSSFDPGPGPLELSIRLPRGALKRAAVLRRTSGTALLRRLIAAYVEPRESPSPRAAVDVRSNFVSPSVGSVGAYSPRTRPPGPAFGSVPVRSEAAPAKPLTILTTVERYRSLEEIGREIQRGGGITSEELIRWQSVHQRR